MLYPVYFANFVYWLINENKNFAMFIMQNYPFATMFWKYSIKRIAVKLLPILAE